MSAQEAFPSAEQIISELESDLPSLASRAAIELDNIIIGQEWQADVIGWLADKIASSCSTTNVTNALVLLCDPSAAVILNHAFADSRIVDRKLSTVEELIDKAGELGTNLRDVLADPEGFRRNNPAQLVQMRAFCVALSRRASAYGQSIEDYEHTYCFGR